MFKKRYKIFAVVGGTGTAMTLQYRHMKKNYPDVIEDKVWKPFMSMLYPKLLKVLSHDYLHLMFHRAAENSLLPKYESTLQ